MKIFIDLLLYKNFGYASLYASLNRHHCSDEFQFFISSTDMGTFLK